MQNKHGGSIRSHDCYLKRWVKNSLTPHSFCVMESRVSSNCTRIVHSPCTKEVNWKENTVGKIAKSLRMLRYRSWRTFIPWRNVMRQRKSESFEQDLSRFLRWNFAELFACKKKKFMTKFEIEVEHTKLQIARKLSLKPLFFWAFKWSAEQISQIVKILRDRRKSGARPNYQRRALPFVEP